MVGVAGIVALAAATLSPLPLLCGLVAEAAYLLFVPDTAWFAKRIEKRFDAEVIAHRLELRNRVFPKIRQEIKDRFLWLEQARQQIESTTGVQDKWFREALRKLDFLMEKYLQFAEREAEFLAYLFSLVRESYPDMTPDEIHELPSVAKGPMNAPAATYKVTQQDVKDLIESITHHYERQLKNLGESLEKETVVPTIEILTKRKQVLERRRDFIVRLSDMLANLRHQMELIAETFGLINDEMRARSPEQVLADIDDVVAQATSLTDALDDVTPVDQVVAKL